jgi:predicted transcriptional regulator
MTKVDTTRRGKRWLFMTNHAHVLVSIAREPGMRMRDIADQVGITERAVQLILRDLEHEGYVAVRRVGRRNFYEIKLSAPMRHPLHEGHVVDELLAILS